MMSTERMEIICQECGQKVFTDEHHTYDDCIAYKTKGHSNDD